MVTSETCDHIFSMGALKSVLFSRLMCTLLICTISLSLQGDFRITHSYLLMYTCHVVIGQYKFSQCTELPIDGFLPFALKT